MKMKTGVEQSVYAALLLNMLPDGAVLHSKEISRQIGASPTYFQKLLRKMGSADLITSVPGTKGGFKLKKRPEDIRVYDIYVAIEGQQSLYTPSGIFDGMLELGSAEEHCILGSLMDEAEDSWKSVLKRETIASLTEKLQAEQYSSRMDTLRKWLDEKMIG
jgi:Rrf2 family protein